MYHFENIKSVKNIIQVVYTNKVIHINAGSYWHIKYFAVN